MSLYRVWLPTLDGVTLVVLEADDAAEMSRRAPGARVPERSRNGLRLRPIDVAVEARIANG